MTFDVQIAHSVSQVDPAAWDHLGQGYPFASYDWYRFGEAVLFDNRAIYIILSREDEPVARATLWLRKREQIPLSSRVLRYLLQKLLGWWPLLLCKSPLADTSGLILPDSDLRDAALNTIAQVAHAQARQHSVSFAAFIYLEPQDTQGWPDPFATAALPDPGTRLFITWPDFDSYMKSLSKSTRKDYRRHRNRAADLGIQVKRHPQVADLDTALRLIRNVETHHNTAPFPWSREMLQNLDLTQATWLTAEIENRVVACGLLVRDGPDAVMRLLGMDYNVKYAYFQLVYEAIAATIEQGARALWGGAGAYKMKKRLGFQLTDDYYTAFAGMGPILRRLGHWAASMEENKAAEPA